MKQCCSNCENLRTETDENGWVNAWCVKKHFDGVENPDDVITWIDCKDFKLYFSK